MINIIDSSKRHIHKSDWLKAVWLFSFSDYYDENNISHGNLRVFNDDIVQPGEGFPLHPHKEMEIITLIIDGELTHEDNMGNKMTIQKDEVQLISAGTGIKHSEYNLSDKPVNLYQIWILPNKSHLKPTYKSKAFHPDLWKNSLHPLVSGENIPDALPMNANATIYRGFLEKNAALTHFVKEDIKSFIYVVSGRMAINSFSIKTKDQARVEHEPELTLKAFDKTEFILIDVA